METVPLLVPEAVWLGCALNDELTVAETLELVVGVAVADKLAALE